MTNKEICNRLIDIENNLREANADLSKVLRNGTPARSHELSDCRDQLNELLERFSWVAYLAKEELRD